jgi:4-amino-4-deoxy-L-arabinose transferase-like glycosyltransferase
MPIDSPVTPSERSHRAELVFALVALVFAAAFQLHAIWPGLQREAIDREEIFTAISIRSLVTDGFQLDYPTPVLGRPWKLPAEPGLYHNVAAGAARVTGASAETAGRAVALAFFYLGLPAVFLLARRLGASRAGALLAVAFWLLSPFGCVHANALTPTTAAVTFSAWWLWLFLQSLAAPALRYWLAAALGGMVAAPAGLATFLPFALAGVIFWLRTQRGSPRRWSVAVSAAAGLLPALLAATLWARHAGLLRDANPYANSVAAMGSLASAFGPLAQRLDGDFWILYLGTLFTTLVVPLTGLLLLVFSAVTPAGNKAALARLATTIVLGLALLLPLYDAQPRELGSLILLASLVVAGFAGNLVRGKGAAFWVAAGLVLVAQTQLKVTSTEEMRSPLPDAAELAQAVAAATQPNDLVITAGQDWDLLFAYRANRRAVLVPAGRETDLPALIRAVGDRRDFHVGAVVLTGRYRSEPAYLADLRRLFNLTEKPLMQTAASDVYFPSDEDAEARKRLGASSFASLLRSDGTPAPPAAAPAKVPSTARVAVTAKLPPFSMMSPQPSRYSVPYDLAAHEIDGAPCFFAHAPTTLEFDLPRGGTQLAMEFFMAEGTYTGKGDTDGADVVAAIHHRDGMVEELFHRHLDPVNVRADRRIQTATVLIKGEPGSTLFIESLPGPKMRANFDWVYFRRIEIK